MALEAKQWWPQLGKPLGPPAWASLHLSWAGSGNVPAGSRGWERWHQGHFCPQPGATQQRPILLAQVSHTGLATSGLPVAPDLGTLFWTQVGGSGEGVLHPGGAATGPPAQARKRRARPSPSLPWPSLGREGRCGGAVARRPAGLWLSRQRWQQRPGHLGDDIGAVWPAGASGQAGAEHGHRPRGWWPACAPCS